jgi:hypothetical protein
MQKASQTNLTQKRQIKVDCFCKKHKVSCLQISPHNRDYFSKSLFRLYQQE